MDDNKNLSVTEEMYLVTIRKLCEFCSNTPVPIPEIAKELGVQPVSASQMINKLVESGYLSYLPYKGAELTEKGIKVAARILRHRRLWEVFLVKVLNMNVDEADALACQIEHVTSKDVASRLSTFLGNPKVCFHGAPIPQEDSGELTDLEGVPLASLQMGQSGQVIRFTCGPSIERFLNTEGIIKGCLTRIAAVGDSGDMLVEVADHHVHLSGVIAESVVVIPSTQKQKTQKDKQMETIMLSELSVGQKGIIQKINFRGSLRQRLLAMGLVVGETIQVKKVAPLGDPVDFVIKGYDLSLRKSEAEEVLVTLVNEE